MHIEPNIYTENFRGHTIRVVVTPLPGGWRWKYMINGDQCGQNIGEHLPTREAALEQATLAAQARVARMG